MSSDWATSIPIDEGFWGGAIEVFTAAGFVNPCDTPGDRCGATWPGAASRWPAVLQIDHAFGRGLQFLSASVVKRGGSDHYPLLVRFEVNGDGGGSASATSGDPAPRIGKGRGPVTAVTG